jgi:hypothetical protein
MFSVKPAGVAVKLNAETYRQKAKEVIMRERYGRCGKRLTGS